MFSAFYLSRKISRLFRDLQQFSKYHDLNSKVSFLRRSRDTARNVLIRRAFPLPIFLLIFVLKFHDALSMNLQRISQYFMVLKPTRWFYRFVHRS